MPKPSQSKPIQTQVQRGRAQVGSKRTPWVSPQRGERQKRKQSLHASLHISHPSWLCRLGWRGQGECWPSCALMTDAVERTVLWVQHKIAALKSKLNTAEPSGDKEIGEKTPDTLENIGLTSSVSVS